MIIKFRFEEFCIVRTQFNVTISNQILWILYCLSSHFYGRVLMNLVPRFYNKIFLTFYWSFILEYLFLNSVFIDPNTNYIRARFGEYCGKIAHINSLLTYYLLNFESMIDVCIYHVWHNSFICIIFSCLQSSYEY